MKSRIMKKRLRAREENLMRRIVAAVVKAVTEAMLNASAAQESTNAVNLREIIRALISAVDLTEIAVYATSNNEKTAADDAGTLAGQTLTVLHRKLLELLELLDVRPISRDVGFVDYSLHEPVRVHVARDGPESEGRITAVVRAGYLEGPRVLRPMLVEVLKYMPKIETQPKEKEESTHGENKEEN